MSLGHRKKIRGLGMVEALVATTLAVTLIGGLLTVLGSTSNATARIETQRNAQSLARALLASHESRAERGAHNGLIWERRVERSPFDPNHATQDGFRLQRVTIVVSDPALGTELRVATERLLR